MTKAHVRGYHERLKMFFYKATIQSGPLREIKFYKSIRKRGKRNVARGVNRSLTPEKQEKANRLRSEQNIQRLILCNFSEGDRWVRFSAPYVKFTEKEFEKEVARFFRRVWYHTRKAGLVFKYIGFVESGKNGDNWHLHIIVPREISEIAEKQWKWKQGIYSKPLYLEGAFADLAHYITKDAARHKDTGLHKRMKTSRNLSRPSVEVKEHCKREYRRVERGELLPAPEGYYFLKDDSFSVNDITGAIYSFSFLQLNARGWWEYGRERE